MNCRTINYLIFIITILSIGSYLGLCSCVSEQSSVGKCVLISPKEQKLLDTFRAESDLPNPSITIEEVIGVLVEARWRAAKRNKALTAQAIIEFFGSPDSREKTGEYSYLNYRAWTKGGRKEYLRLILINDALVATGSMSSIE